MGSKRKISHEIIKFILKRHPDSIEFYDVFCGGGAMSFVALQIPQFQKCFYNEINPQIVELIRYCQNLPKDKELYKLGQIYPDKFYEWVSREAFAKNKDRKDYYGGLISCIWSFGNSGKGYMFGKEVEETKRLAHMVCVYKDSDCLKKLNALGIKISSKILTLSSIYSRRLFIKSEVERNKGVSDLQQLQQLQRLQQLEQLEQLQRLERLQQLEQLQQLQLSNCDYKNFDFSNVSKNAIVYLDPPYIGTTGYTSGIINYDEFYKWIHKIKAHIYLSSYESPMDVVKIMKHFCTLNKKVYEKLFYKNGCR